MPIGFQLKDGTRNPDGEVLDNMVLSRGARDTFNKCSLFSSNTPYGETQYVNGKEVLNTRSISFSFGQGDILVVYHRSQGESTYFKKSGKQFVHTQYPTQPMKDLAGRLRGLDRQTSGIDYVESSIKSHWDTNAKPVLCGTWVLMGVIAVFFLVLVAVMTVKLIGLVNDSNKQIATQVATQFHGVSEALGKTIEDLNHTKVALIETIEDVRDLKKKTEAISTRVELLWEYATGEGRYIGGSPQSTTSTDLAVFKKPENHSTDIVKNNTSEDHPPKKSDIVYDVFAFIFGALWVIGGLVSALLFVFVIVRFPCYWMLKLFKAFVRQFPQVKPARARH